MFAKKNKRIIIFLMTKMNIFSHLHSTVYATYKNDVFIPDGSPELIISTIKEILRIIVENQNSTNHNELMQRLLDTSVCYKHLCEIIYKKTDDCNILADDYDYRHAKNKSIYNDKALTRYNSLGSVNLFLIIEKLENWKLLLW